MDSATEAQEMKDATKVRACCLRGFLSLANAPCNGATDGLSGHHKARVTVCDEQNGVAAARLLLVCGFSKLFVASDRSYWTGRLQHVEQTHACLTQSKRQYDKFQKVRHCLSGFGALMIADVWCSRHCKPFRTSARRLRG